MEDKSLQLLKNFIGDFSEVHMGSMGSFNIEPPFETKARDYLKFAEYDLSNEYNHHNINALSNVKRAIDCQIDTLLFSFGLLEISKEERWTFPRKIDFLNDAGIISPRILKKINRKRNVLEHEYRNPLTAEVEDAVDVAILFMEYTEKFLVNALYDCEVVKDNDTEGYFGIKMDYELHQISLYYYMDENTIPREATKIIKPGSAEYNEYLKFFISLYRLT